MKIRFAFLVMAVGMINQACAGSDITDAQVREWVAEGRIMSFVDIMAANKSRLDGRLLDLEIEQEDDSIVYEVEVLREDGEVREFHIDAASGSVLKEERDD
ncbi:Peptidase propeptide and YPEB domain-containing protein [Amphritea atlantica]|uniref:Peptidase propeptide and YPEB domain-containing protein n=1 Tax=Amphritea atlantica TaxID=355243 RepID=A0A1H9CM72_9GAMM|nr:PepSY domain-containing protein [Amphritea atlantica]SEQ02264.1 Peptidase propeptide and YPEB domain-containing protein [Amphritea atlantica]